MSGDIVLDPKIRDWVLVPIVVAMFLQNMLRDYGTRLITSTPKTELESIRDMQVMRRSAMLKANGHWIPPSAFKMRRCYFNDKEKGVFSKEASRMSISWRLFSRALPLRVATVARSQVRVKTPAEMMTDNPAMGMEGMKKNMGYALPQMIMMGWINYFFSGFVMGLSLMPRPSLAAARQLSLRVHATFVALGDGCSQGSILSRDAALQGDAPARTGAAGPPPPTGVEADGCRWWLHCSLLGTC